MQNHWQVQDAKARFSEVVDRAQRNGPQFIRKHGRHVAVIISADDYAKLAHIATSSLSEFLSNSGLSEIPAEDRDSSDIVREVEL